MLRQRLVDPCPDALSDGARAGREPSRTGCSGSTRAARRRSRAPRRPRARAGTRSPCPTETKCAISSTSKTSPETRSRIAAHCSYCCGVEGVSNLSSTPEPYAGPMAAPVRPDDELDLRIESLAYGGNGVARLNGFVVFVRRGLPGDVVRARVTRREAQPRGSARARGRRGGSAAGRRARASTTRPAEAAGSRISRTRRSSRRRRRRSRRRYAGSGESTTRRSSRSSRPSRSSTTGTRWSTRSRRRRTARRSASTAPAAGTRCWTSASAG